MTRREAIEIAAIVIRDMKNGEYPSVKSYKLVEALETLIQSPWISVKERLPEETEHEYLFGSNRIVKESGNVFTLHRNGTAIMNKARNGEWIMPLSNGSPVTHWMPIPSLND